jgi:hypothetical protein
MLAGLFGGADAALGFEVGFGRGHDLGTVARGVVDEQEERQR